MDKKNKIIVIDDNPEVLKVLSEALEGLGYDCHTAQDGYQGLEKINSNRFDVVLSDIEMSNIDSLEFLKRIKELDPDLPVVMVSFTVVTLMMV